MRLGERIKMTVVRFMMVVIHLFANSSEGVYANIIPEDDAQITFYNITSTVRHRYASTVIDCIVENNNDVNGTELELNFAMPSDAFLTGVYYKPMYTHPDVEFTKAIVKERKEAEAIYHSQRQQGHLSGIVSLKDPTIRDSEDVSLRVSLKKYAEDGSAVRVKLQYEYLLNRRSSSYRVRLPLMPLKNIKKLIMIPGPNFNFKTVIDETLPLKSDDVYGMSLNAKLVLYWFDGNVRQVQMSEKKIPKNHISLSNDGPNILSGTNIIVDKIIKQSDIDWEDITGLELQVDYDIERRQQSSYVETIGSYFMHSFVTNGIDQPARHLIFVLDKSGSMENKKMTQLKDSMMEIIRDLTNNKDYFNIIAFDNEMRNWHPENVILNNNRHNDRLKRRNLTVPIAVEPYLANKENKENATEFVLDLKAGGLTDITSPLEEALKLALHFKKSHRMPMIILLTDGKPTDGSNTTTILQNIQPLVDKAETPIFTLGFGKYADVDLLKNIARISSGRFKTIYEANDATNQMSSYYKEICSPLLKELSFTYLANDLQVEKTEKCGMYFKDEENVVIGQFVPHNSSGDLQEMTITGKDGNGTQIYTETYKECNQSETSQSAQAFSPSNSSGDLQEMTIAGLGSNETHINSGAIASNTVPACFDVPDPTKEVGNSRSDSGSLERMWAFSKIKEILSRPGTNDINNYTNEALRLALDYGFVTPLTSLVFSTNLANTGRTIPNTYKNQNEKVSIRFGSSVPPEIESVLTDEELNTEECSIKMYPDTNFRTNSGPSLTLESPKNLTRGSETSIEALIVNNLANFNFDDMLLSFKIKGRCCWTMFEGIYQSSESKQFKPDDYENAESLGPFLASGVSSLKASNCEGYVDEFTKYV